MAMRDLAIPGNGQGTLVTLHRDEVVWARRSSAVEVMRANPGPVASLCVVRDRRRLVRRSKDKVGHVRQAICSRDPSLREKLGGYQALIMAEAAYEVDALLSQRLRTS
jgi:hypothetical protein